ncbi:hypothetical protein MTR67_027389 [Solanum verrucosum]|uniref:Uncharacterized protein n=1 Tax=Solanum verrucosum TaxID=315347 RepID=A0AAF0R0L8_SOLVR|nr:hypothetical protein MTR67_027389 [Solanum verrucosum]
MRCFNRFISNSLYHHSRTISTYQTPYVHSQFHSPRFKKFLKPISTALLNR